MALNRAWIRGFKPVRGSARLIGLRWMLWIVAAMPGVAVATGGLGEAVGRRPYFADAPDPLPVIELSRLMGEIPGSVWGVLAIGAAIAWFGNLLLTAGAVAILDPSASGKVAVWRTIFDTGTRRLWAYLRIALLAAVLVALGGRLVSFVFERLGDHGEIAGWTGKTLSFTLPLVRSVLFLLWASLVGVLAWWCRVIVVAGSRRYVRRLPSLVARLWWRHPLQGLLFHLASALSVLLLGGLVLIAWRQSSVPATGWIALWLVVLLAQATVWHWRLRACRLLWSVAELGDLRACPDEPWHPIRRLRRRAARARASAVEPPAPPPRDADPEIP